MRYEWDAAGLEYLMEHAARGDPRAFEIVRELLLSQWEGDGREVGPVKTVVIGVCTAMRPRMLSHCLDAIAAQIVPRGVEIHVVVVDNEAAPNSRHLVYTFGSRCPFPVHYVHEGRLGISPARNAVLRQALALRAEWIAMTDDDCWVSPAWLAGLLEAAARHKADVVYGRREFLFPLCARWAPPEPANHVEGQLLPYAATHNVLMRGWVIHDADCHGTYAGLRFDERLAHGEDTDLFHRAAKRGARIVYARAPVVFETVSAERATLTFQTRRAYYYAASRSYFHRRHKGFARATGKLAARWMFQVPVAVLRLASAPFVLPLSGLAFRDCVVKGATRLAGAAGATAGLLGFDGDPYRTIQGC